MRGQSIITAIIAAAAVYVVHAQTTVTEKTVDSKRDADVAMTRTIGTTGTTATISNPEVGTGR